jgi:hypothetical protein
VISGVQRILNPEARSLNALSVSLHATSRLFRQILGERGTRHRALQEKRSPSRRRTRGSRATGWWDPVQSAIVTAIMNLRSSPAEKKSPRAAPCRPRTAGGQRRHQSAAVEQSAEALVPYEHVARKGQQRAAGILDRTIVQSRRVAGLARSCALLACSRLLQPGGGEARRVGADAINRRAILGDAILRLTANDGGVTPGRPADNRKRVQRPMR